MKSSFRWYGDSDPVTLDMIRQIPGMRSIVSAVYDVKPGEVWPEESIKHLVDECAEKGLIFDLPAGRSPRPDPRVRQARRGTSVGKHRVFPQARYSGRRGMRRRDGSPSG